MCGNVDEGNCFWGNVYWSIDLMEDDCFIRFLFLNNTNGTFKGDFYYGSKMLFILLRSLSCSEALYLRVFEFIWS